MVGKKLCSLLAAGAASLSVACVVLLAGAGSALACTPDTDGDCYHPNYHVQRTDGSLTEWSGPGTGRIVGSLGGDGTPVEVACETTGATEDGLPYVVWDQLDDGTYVYGYYLDTPGDGYHPALAACSGSSGGTQTTPSPSPGGGGTNPQPQPPAAGGGSPRPNHFNTAGAAAWAKANAYKIDNPYNYSDDCTDFVSRAMHFGGGMPEQMVRGILPFNRTDDRNWYVYPALGLVRSYSWGAAPHLANFLRITGWGRQVSLQAAKPGDLMFVNWGRGGRDTPQGQTDMSGQGGIDHVGMIVGNPGSQGGYDVQIAQHTNNTIEKLSDWRKPNPNLHVFVYSIYY
jgi:hypothetical protein